MLRRQEATESLMQEHSKKYCFDDDVDVRWPVYDCHVGVYMGREV
jgi:hypothetical protein